MSLSGRIDDAMRPLPLTRSLAPQTTEILMYGSVDGEGDDG